MARNYNSYFNKLNKEFDTGYGSATKAMNLAPNPYYDMRYNTNPYLKGYSFSDVNVDSLVDSHQNMMNETYLLGLPNGGRSMLDRVFDTLLVGNYASAGFAKGLVDNGSQNDITPWEGIEQGIKAANPFGNGFEKGEYSYSKVFEEMGWKPETTVGKVARGTAGFVADVLLDPTTYLSGGLSALLKGSGRVGKAGQTIEKMTPDMAMDIIENVNKSRGVKIADEQLLTDADNFAREYNKLRGIREPGDGLTLSLGNMPFGQKVFGDLANRKVTLATDEALRSLSDTTIAPLYARARDSFLGGKLGELFSTKSVLYRLSKEDPANLYDFLKFVDYTKGLNLDKFRAEKLIRDKSKQFGMTPAEQKEVLSLLQDKSIWNRVSSFVTLGQTGKAQQFKEELSALQSKRVAELDEIQAAHRELEELKKVEGVDSAALKALEEDYRRVLIDFDVKAYKKKGDLLRHNQLLRNELASLNGDAGFEGVRKKLVDEHVEYTERKKQLGNNSNTNLIDSLNNHLFGGKRVISYASPDGAIENLMKRIEDGTSVSTLRFLVESDPKTFSGTAKELYSYVAGKLGYSTWEEAYRVPMKELQEKLKKGTLSGSDVQKMNSLEQLKLKRDSLLKQFDGVTSTKAVRERIRQLENKSLYDELDEARVIEKPAFTDGRNTERGTPFAQVDYFDKKGKDGKWQSVAKEREEFTPQEVQLSKENRTQMWVDVAKFMKWMGKGSADPLSHVVNLPTNRKNYIERVVKHMADIVNGTAHLSYMDDIRVFENYQNLPDYKKKAIFDAARKLADRDIKQSAGKTGGQVEGASSFMSKGKPERLAKIAADLEKMKAERDLAKNVATQREDIIKQIEDNENTITALGDTRASLIADYKSRIAEAEKRVNTFNKSYEELRSKVVPEDELVEREFELERIADALADDDALEQYMRITLGNEAVEKALGNTHVTMTALDSRMDISEKVKEITKALRGEFMEIAKNEVRIGKLTPEQMEANLMSYVPHILTPEGAKYFSDQRELRDKMPSLTQALGYGRKFNPFGKERKLTKIELNGEWIENPTVEQLNEYFAKHLKGKNAFADNVADLYIARALKHTELMYDEQYMQEMMTTFGTRHNPGDEIPAGYTAVVNFGLMRKELGKLARIKAGDDGVAFENALENLLAGVGLNRNILEDLATPMIELNSHQADELAKLSGNFKVSRVNDAIVMKANQARKSQIAKDKNRLLQGYDKVTHLLKLNMTTVMPSFHIRNKLANMYLNWLGVGKDALDLKTQMTAFRLAKSRGQLESKDVMMVTGADGNLTAMPLNEIYELAKSYNVIDEGFFAKDIGASTRTSGVLKGVRPKYDPTDSENFILYRKGGEIGNLIENSDRLTHFMARLKQGDTIERAAQASREFLFDYSDLTAFEQNFMKRIIPFYTWLRKNSALQVEQLIEQPGKFQLVAKAMQGIEGMNNEEERISPLELNSFARDWVQTPFRTTNEMGQQEPILWNPNLPFNDISRIPDPFNVKESMREIFTQSNPIIKVPIEQAMNTNVFLDKQIVEDNEPLDRAEHVAQQAALPAFAINLANKNTDTDALLHIINALTGVKTMSYDVETFRQMSYKKKLEEMGE